MKTLRRNVEVRTLGQAQRLFSQLAARLIIKAEKMGYAVTLGEAWRHPQAKHGLKGGTHSKRLGIDLNLFRVTLAKELKGSKQEYLTRTEDHARLGAWWKRQHPLCRWGGDFRKRDGNHYSLTWGGVM